MARPLSKAEEKRTLIKIWDFHFNASQARQEMMERYIESMKHYMAESISDADKQVIYNRGQTDVSVPYLRFFIRKLVAFMTANQPQWTAFAVNNDDSRTAKLANALLSHIWRLSKGYMQITDIIKNMVVGGIGYSSAYIDYSKNNGLGEVLWRSLPVPYFYGDWRSKDPAFDDMSAQQVAFTIPLSTAQTFIKDRREDLKTLVAQKGIYDTVIEQNKIIYGEVNDPYESVRVLRLSHYQIEEDDIFELTDLVDGQKMFLNDRPNLPLPYAVDIRKVSRPRLVKYDCIYGMGEDNGIIYNVTKFPFSTFLIRPFIDEFTGNPFAIGEGFFLEKIQKYIDKSLRIALQHEMWNSNPGVFLPKGSVDDRAEFEKRVMFPGFVEEIDMEAGVPVFKQAAPNQSGFYKIVEFMIDTMKFGTGNMFDPSQARGNKSEDAFLKQVGQEQGDLIFRNFESGLEQAAKSQLELSKYHYDFPTLLKFIDKRRKPATMLVNKTFVTPQGEIESFKISEIDTDIALSSRSYTPTDRQVNAEKIIKAMQFSPPQVLDILFIELAKAMELDPDIVDEVEFRTKVLPQLQQQLQQMQDNISKLDSENKKLKDQVFTADRKAVRASYDAELQKIIDKIKNNFRNAEKMFNNNLKANQKIQQALARKGVQNGGTEKAK